MDDKFIKALDDWLFKNQKKDAESIKKQKSKIDPNFKKWNQNLYRGMTVTPDFLNIVNDGKMVFKDITSWSVFEHMAKKFATDNKYIVGTKSKGTQILISKKIPNQKIIFNIYYFVMMTGGIGLDPLSSDSALNEGEILVDKGIKILPEDITFI